MSYCLLRQYIRTLQRYDTVKYQFSRLGILVVHAEEALSYELEAVIRLCLCKCRLQTALCQCGQRIGVQIQTSVFIVYTLLFIDDILIQAHLCFYRLLCIYPVDRSLYFTSIGAVASAALRIIGTMYFHDFPFSSLTQPVHFTK